MYVNKIKTGYYLELMKLRRIYVEAPKKKKINRNVKLKIVKTFLILSTMIINAI